MSLVKRLSVFALAVVTTLSLAGVQPALADNHISAGSLLALEGSSDAAVYYIGSDGMKYVFPDSKTYFTWYENFDNVMRVDVATLDEYEDGGAVTYRPGTKLVTHMNTAKVYAVGPGGMLYWIPTEEVAVGLYGDNWGSMVMDVIPGYFSSSYSTGDELSDMYPTGTLVQMGETIYYIDGSTKRAFANADAFEANNFSYDNVLDVDDLSDYTDGDSITGEEMELSGFMPSEDDDVPTPSGTLTVNLSSSTPDGDTVPKGATGVEVAKYNLSAGGGDATITSLKVERGSIGSRTDVSKVYIFNGDTRLSSGRTLNSDDEASFNLNFDVDSNETLSIVVDFSSSATASNIHSFGIKEVVSTAAEVNGSMAMGKKFTIGGQAVGNLDIENKNAYSATATEVKIGEEGLEIAEFDIDSVGSQEDLALTGLTLKNAGNADASDLGNIELYYQGSKVADGSYDGDYLVFTFDEITLEKSESNYNFKVRADIEGGIDNTVRFYFDEKADIKAVGKSYGYNADVDITDMDTSTECYNVQIKGGTITVNYATDNNETVIADQTDFVFATLEVNTAEDVDVDQFQVTVDETDGGDVGVIDIDNVEIRNVETGSVYDGTVVSGADDDAATSVIWKFEDVIWEMGDGTWEIRGDIPNTASSSDAYEFDIDFTSGFTAEFVDSNESVTAATDLSSTSLTGSTYTIGGSSLTVVPGAFNNGESVIDAEGVTIAGGTFDTGSTSGVNITEVAFHGKDDYDTTTALDATDDTYFDKDNIQTVTLWGDENNDGTWEELDTVNYASLTNGEVSFDNFELYVGKDGSVPFLVTADIDSTLDGSNTNLRIQMTSVTATDDNNDTVNAVETGESSTISTTVRIDFGRVVSLYSVGTLTVAQDNDVNDVDTNKYVLAGSTGNKVARLKFSADYEDVKITKLSLYNAVATAYDSVNSVKITDANGTVLASEVFIGATATFENDNGLFTVEEGTQYYYVVADYRAIDSDSPTGTADSQDYLSITIPDSYGVEAQGYSTGSDLASYTNTADTDTTYTSTVVGTKVNAVTDATSASLSTGETEIFRFTVTLDTSATNASTTGDDLEAVLEELAIQLNYNSSTMTTTAVDSSNYLKLYRVGKSGYATATIPASGSKSTFDFSDSDITMGTGWTSANREISVSDTSATFYVKATNVTGADTNDYVQAKIANLDGSAGTLGTNYDVQWHDGTGNLMYGFLLGYDEVIGDSVN